jgi:hypothetical protein
MHKLYNKMRQIAIRIVKKRLTIVKMCAKIYACEIEVCYVDGYIVTHYFFHYGGTNTMKRILVLMLALAMAAAFACCDSKTPEETTTEAEVTTEAPATTEEPTEAPTEAPTETTEEDITLPPETTEAPTTVGWTEPENPSYDVVESPVFNPLDDRILHGYHASGEFDMENACALSKTENCMFVVTNDRLPSGKITATFKAPEQYVNDNGIIFGMEENTNEQYTFWEDGPMYYFLFVSDDATLYLAKVGYDGEPWTELQVSAPIENYQHGEKVGRFPVAV